MVRILILPFFFFNSMALEISVPQFYHLTIGMKIVLLKHNFQKGKIVIHVNIK